MSLFELTWIFKDEPDKPKSFWSKAANGFDAECSFLAFADIFAKPVKVVRVEKVA